MAARLKEMEDNKKSGYSAEGRKLRPRKKVSSFSDDRSSNAERYDFREKENSGEERRSYNGGQRSNYSSNGERRSYGEGRQQGERRSYGEHRSYGDRQYSSNRSNGEGRSYGERSSYGERRSYNGGQRSNYSSNGEHRSYGEGRQQGERRSYGEHRNYGEHRSYGDRQYNGNRSGEGRSYGERSNYGERRSYNDGQRSNYSSNGERRSYGEGRQQGGYKSYGSRPQNGRKPYGKPQSKPFHKKYDAAFSETDEEGINKMIASRPALDMDRFSDNDMAPVPFKEEVRLNKFIANSGVCSRREADTFIQAGVVTVNGEVVTELGTKINVLNDDVRFNGERLKGEEKVYIVMNKPKEYVTTSSDPHAEKTVMDLLKGCTSRVFPVGRLDKNTTGVLMFTNDGEIAERLTHPSYDKKKIYQVMLDSELTQEDYDKILAGVTLSDGDVAADALEFIDDKDHRKVGIEIHSGKNRIVRRIFESLGYYVRALDRVYFAGLTKKGLQKGEWRYLTEGEVNILKMGAYI